MARIGIRCKQCESTYDVTDFEPGSQVQCGVCSAILTVPQQRAPAAAPVAPVAAPTAPVAEEEAEAPPARKGAARRPSARGATRGARKAAGKKAARSSSTRRAPEAEDAPAAKAPARGSRRSAATTKKRAPAVRAADPAEAEAEAPRASRAPSRSRSGRRTGERASRDIKEGVRGRAAAGRRTGRFAAEEVEGEERPRYQPKQSSNAGLWVSLVAVGIVAVVGLLFYSGALEKPPAPEPVDPEPTQPEGDPEAWAKNKVTYETSFSDQKAKFDEILAEWAEEKPGDVAKTAATLAGWINRAILEKRERYAMPDADFQVWQERMNGLIKTAVELDPDNGDARRLRGDKSFRLEPATEEVFDSLPPEVREELLPWLDKWVTKEKFDELKELEQEAASQVSADPETAEFVSAANSVLDNFKYYEILKDKKWHFKISERDDGKRGHYLLFSEKREDKEFSDELLRRGRLLERAYDHLKREYFEPMGLTRDETNPLVAISLADRQSYIDLTNRYFPGGNVGEQSLGHFNPRIGYFFFFEGVSANQGVTDDEVMLHEGTHQIESAFCDDMTNPENRDVRPGWRVEGWAEYVASFDAKTIDKKRYWEFGSPPQHRVQLVKRLRDGNGPLPQLNGKDLVLPARQLVGVMNAEGMMAEVRKLLPREIAMSLSANPFFENQVTNLMYAQGCLFINFMMAGEGGKYREPFRKYMEATFKGKCQINHSSRKELATALGFDHGDEDAWKKLDREFRKYLDEVL